MTREEAIRDIEECILPYVGGISLRMAIEALKDRPHGEWIPCSERLPEEHSFCLVTIKRASGISYTASAYFFSKEVGWNEACVIAWMPIPKPYEKEGDAE